MKSGETMNSKPTTLAEMLAKKILILDGAMGTMIQQQGLKAEDFGGTELEGCNEILNITCPDIVRGIHESYLQAGADIIETNSFGATSVVLKEYQLADKDIELNRIAAGLARQAADQWSSPSQPRFVAGSMGPTTKMLALTGGVTFTELAEAYYRQAMGLLTGGVDLLLVETCQDTLNVKAAGVGIHRAFKELGLEVPIMISCTIEPSGTMLAGQNIESFYISVRHLNPLAVGLNCGTGAELMNDHLRTIAGIASCGVSCYPNAGLPDEEGNYLETPEDFALKMLKYADNGWLNIAGGCCGTTDRHIQALAAALSGCTPRKDRAEERSSISGIEAVWPEEDNRPLLVGERSNVIGSRKFKDLITEERWEEGSEIARAQVKKGAQVIDICVANPDRNELQDMLRFLPHVVTKVKAPLMLDSTDPGVIEAGLRLIQGKAVINSINLENGLERFEDVVPLIKRYGAAVVVGVIDEEGMALTRERKLAVAERSYDLLVNRYGLLPGDIIFDPLTFPVGTGDAKYLGSAVETIEGLRLIKKKLPECKTILGISNVSFGLPAAGREVLNAVFVYLNTLAGLDYAIVNAEKLERYASIPQNEKKLAENLLLDTNDQTLKEFTDFYREKKAAAKRELQTMSLEDRLANCIIEGSKDGLEKDIQEALARYTPLEIINGPLMRGMEEVGRLFNENQLIVAEVLQSAEVMKAAVTLLEPHMEKAEEAVKGKILLATVKGDVHDIGKNLVEIILANNGYKVVNLGVKVSSEQLIDAARKEKPDAIGLSGLLVKSVQQMLLSAQDLRDNGIDIPLILGGAALSRRFTEEKIAPAYQGPVLYARDAMDSLTLLNNLLAKGKITNNQKGPGKLDNGDSKVYQDDLDNHGSRNISNQPGQNESGIKSGVPEGPTYQPSTTKRELHLDYPLAEIIPFLDFPVFMKRYLGVGRRAGLFSQSEARAMERFRNKSEELTMFIQEFLQEIQAKKLIRASGIYAFFPAYSQGNSIFVLDPEDPDPDGETVLEEFTFPRQRKPGGLCPADYLRPKGDSMQDYIGMFALTTGQGIREQAESYRDQGEYLKSYLLQVLALELAEAFAERLHEKIRLAWGFPDNSELSIQDKLHGKYQGTRISPGYPLCPQIEDQKKIFRLLKPEDIGITLTESLMMEPEASITALVFSHPKARIFSLGNEND